MKLDDLSQTMVMLGLTHASNGWRPDPSMTTDTEPREILHRLSRTFRGSCTMLLRRIGDKKQTTATASPYRPGEDITDGLSLMGALLSLPRGQTVELTIKVDQGDLTARYAISRRRR